MSPTLLEGLLFLLLAALLAGYLSALVFVWLPARRSRAAGDRPADLPTPDGDRTSPQRDPYTAAKGNEQHVN
jgi:hypothetical protein